MGRINEKTVRLHNENTFIFKFSPSNKMPTKRNLTYSKFPIGQRNQAEFNH
ncbi:hypothetical protein FIC_02195 [Flavobacteriaceae bacterium 3519-10]|nr:hypothetical protein FIC_02195 [Flavobacteriaceae bacterium 3519-10]